VQEIALTRQDKVQGRLSAGVYAFKKDPMLSSRLSISRRRARIG